MDKYEQETGIELETGKPLRGWVPGPEQLAEFVPRAEYDALVREFQILERTVNGIQQMLGKAADYQGKPRGRLPR